MVAPHGDDERILEKRSGGETLPRILKGPDREIKLAAVQQGRHVALSGLRRSQAETGLKLFLALADGKEPDRSGRYFGKPRIQGGQRRMHRRRFFLGAVRAALAGDKGGHIVGWTFDTIERR